MPHRRSSSIRPGNLPFMLPVAVALLAVTSPARAEITFYQITKYADFSQKSDAQPTTSSQNDLFVTVQGNAMGGYTSGSLTYPGPGSPAGLTNEFGSNSVYAFNAYYTSRVSLDAAFPFGNYTAALTGQAGTDTASIGITQDFYPGTPYLSGMTYSGLQGLITARGYTITWAPVTAGRGVTYSTINLVITDATRGQIAFAPFLSSSATSVLLPSNTLTPGDSYSYSLTFTNKIDLSTTGRDVGLNYQEQTDGTFTAASASVPEPPSLALTGVAGAAGLVVQWLRRRKPATR